MARKKVEPTVEGRKEYERTAEYWTRDSIIFEEGRKKNWHEVSKIKTGG